MIRNPTKIYAAESVAAFCLTREQWGAFSNFHRGFFLRVNGETFRSSEALYQACRFPRFPEAQLDVMLAETPKESKLISQENQAWGATRPDWMAVRVAIMRWCLRVKLCQHQRIFGGLLLASGDLPIVEVSRRDPFWGAAPDGCGRLVGQNVLGELLMELREAMRRIGPPASVEPLPIPDFMLLDDPINIVWASPSISPVAS